MKGERGSEGRREGRGREVYIGRTGGGEIHNVGKEERGGLDRKRVVHLH